MDITYKRDEIAAGLNTPYTMHTATLKMWLTYQGMKIIKKCLLEERDRGENVRKHFKKKESKCQENNKFLVTEKWGFNYIKIITCEINGYPKYWMEIKINPRAMLHHSKYPFVYVANKKDIESCIEVLNKFWKEIGLEWIDSKLFYIQRIDYCVNICLGNEDVANVYMRLMRKGAYPYKSKRMKEYSKTGKRYIDTKNSFTVTSGSFEFSVYSKYKQLKSEEKKYSANEIDRAKGIIRIELRISRNKVAKEEVKHGIQGIEEFLNITSQIAEENIPRYLALSYGKGIFVTIQEAKRRIDATNWKKKTKEKMKKILLHVSRGSLQDVKEYDREKFPYYMQFFNSIGISPITLTYNSVYKKMPNPLYCIANLCANTEEDRQTVDQFGDSSGKYQ